MRGRKKEAGITPGLHASQNETLSAGTPASEGKISDVVRKVKGWSGKKAKQKTEHPADFTC